MCGRGADSSADGLRRSLLQGRSSVGASRPAIRAGGARTAARVARTLTLAIRIRVEWVRNAVVAAKTQQRLQGVSSPMRLWWMRAGPC
jgi:hypothetical protein